MGLWKSAHNNNPSFFAYFFSGKVDLQILEA